MARASHPSDHTAIGAADPAPATASLGTFMGLFRYHGFWSIGVRMFRSMTFVSKAAVISAIFFVVVAQLAFFFVRASNQAIHAS